MSEKRKFQIIEKSVTSGAEVAIDEISQKDYHKIEGVFIHSTDTQGTQDSLLELDVDNEEILPKDFEASLIEVNSYNSWKEAMLPLEEKADGSTIQGKYTDGGNASSYPYTLKLYIVCKQKR